MEELQILVFLDNIDQRPHSFQEHLFTIAESLAETWPAAVFVALRPDTFYESRSRGALAAYQPRVFAIAPPRVDRVIHKRLTYALYLLEEEGRLPGLPQQVTLESGTLADYVRSLLHSFEENEDLQELMDNLSGGNIRTALGFLENFIGSPQVSTERILAQLEHGEPHYIQVHEILMSIILGEYRYFFPSASPILNVYDISSPDGREHFLLPILLEFVERSGGNGGSEGFSAIDECYEYAGKLGFQAAQTAFQIERAVEKGLLELAPRYGDVPPTQVRLTTVGAYTLKKLIPTFNYMDAMVVDTPLR